MPRSTLTHVAAIAAVLASVVVPSTLCALDDARTAAVRRTLGERVTGPHRLRDLRGNRRALGDIVDGKGLVVVALGVHCPLANLYLPKLIALEKTYRARGVRVIAIYPNDADTTDLVAAHVYDHDASFLALKDFDQRLVDELGLERTPSAAVLDAQLRVVYRGRIDDQYGAAYRRAEPTRRELVDALDAVVAGNTVAVASTEADGCVIGRRPDGDTPTAGRTYSRDIAPILQSRCQGCHRPGRIGPFALLDYDDARDWSAMIREVVVERRMPPWHADSRHGSFRNRRALSNEEIETISSWVEQGAPRGDPADLPPPVEWSDAWSIGAPDAIFAMPEEKKLPADGILQYEYFVVPTGIDADRWIERAEVLPGDASVVHHVIVYIRRKDEPLYRFDGETTALVGWAPGDIPLVCPDGTAVLLPAGADLLFEIHYTPNGRATRDRTRVGIVWAKSPPRRQSRSNIFASHAMDIPAGDPHYRLEHSYRFREDVRLISLMPHMHVRGKAYRYLAEYPDGREEVLLSVPRWDFNWQTVYTFAEPLAIPKGTRIRAIAHWDNSLGNPNNPDPTARVRYGLQTHEEMMNGWLHFDVQAPAETPRGPTREF